MSATQNRSKLPSVPLRKNGARPRPRQQRRNFSASARARHRTSEWERVLRVNLTGTFVCARAVAARMKEVGRGAIVNMGSGRALAGAANGAHYSASKGGIIALTKSLAHDWAGYGIRVNCVIPGITDTAQPRVEMGDNELYAMGSSIPLGRIGQPEDIAAVAAFLLSDDAGYMTGQSVAVNGGAIMIP